VCRLGGRGGIRSAPELRNANHDRVSLMAGQEGRCPQSALRLLVGEQSRAHVKSAGARQR